jgi:hypothetical protein
MFFSISLGFGIPLSTLLMPCPTRHCHGDHIPFCFYRYKKQLATRAWMSNCIFWAIGSYCLLILFCWIFFAGRAAIIPRQYGKMFYLLSAFVSIRASIAGYFANKAGGTP